jgi:hypothetical protein
MEWATQRFELRPDLPPTARSIVSKSERWGLAGEVRAHDGIDDRRRMEHGRCCLVELCSSRAAESHKGSRDRLAAFPATTPPVCRGSAPRLVLEAASGVGFRIASLLRVAVAEPGEVAPVWHQPASGISARSELKVQVSSLASRAMRSLSH